MDVRVASCSGVRERESRRPVVYVGWVENVRSFGDGGGGGGGWDLGCSGDGDGDGDDERRALWERCWRAKISWMCRAWV